MCSTGLLFIPGEYLCMKLLEKCAQSALNEQLQVVGFKLVDANHEGWFFILCGTCIGIAIYPQPDSSV